MGRKEDLLSTIAAAQKELRRIERKDCLPDLEVMNDGTVLALFVTYPRSKPYTYLALKTVRRWFLTGADGDAFTSDGLADWLMDRGRRLVAWHALGTATVEEGVPFVRTSTWHSGALEMGVDRIKVTPLDTKGRPAGTAFVVGGVHKGYGL